MPLGLDRKARPRGVPEPPKVVPPLSWQKSATFNKHFKRKRNEFCGQEFCLKKSFSAWTGKLAAGAGRIHISPASTSQNSLARVAHVKCVTRDVKCYTRQICISSMIWDSEWVDVNLGWMGKHGRVGSERCESKAFVMSNHENSEP